MVRTFSLDLLNKVFGYSFTQLYMSYLHNLVNTKTMLYYTGSEAIYFVNLIRVFV